MNNKYLNRIFGILFLIMIGCGFDGCQKAPINGDLDGRWQILEIETPSELLNVKEEQLYFNFYLHVCNLSFYGGFFTEANFSYRDDTIYLDFPYIQTTDGMRNLTRFGIYRNPVEFDVIYLDRKKLVMGNDESVITLRKF